jgi:hypothetical protein
MSPITPDILINLLTLPTLPRDTPWDTRALLTTIRSLYVILYFSMLRCGNLLPYTQKETDPERHLTWDRINSYDDGVVFDIILSKTIQFKERVQQVALAKLEEKMFSPVTALDNLAQLRGPHHPYLGSVVFQVPTTRGWVPLSKPTAQRILEDQIQAMGLDPTKYRFHSFRHGALQEAVACDTSLEMICLQSDHVSDAVYAYTNLAGSRRFGVSQKVGANLRKILRSQF